MDKTLDPEQMKPLLSIKPEDTLIKPRIKKEGAGEIKAIKLSNEEASLVQAFQDFLVEWRYLSESTFESLFIYVFNLACALHKQVVEYEARMGRVFDPEDLVTKSQD